MWYGYYYIYENGIALKDDYGRDYSATEETCIYDTADKHFATTSMGVIE
jgi:hypothetical protein